MRAGGRILIIFGIVLALIAATAVFIILRNSPAGQAEVDPATIVQSQNVVVAVQTIDPWQEIPADALQIREYPLPLPADAITEEMVITDTATLEGEAAPEGGVISGIQFVNGRISNTRIYPGQVIVSTQLVDKELEETRLGLGSNLSYIIPDGQVAMAVNIDQLSSVAGALRSGDRVDLIGTFTLPVEEGDTEVPDRVTQFFLQNVEILRVGPWVVTEENQEAPSGVVTVLMEPQQALALTRITESVTFRFVLRSITDESEYVTEPVTDDYLIEQFNLRP